MSLDSYDVIRELGRGGMAVVHLARQRDLGRLVALKELAGLNAGDPAFAERFLRESRLAGSLNHANIVTVYEYFEDGGTPFIAMELIEGGSLRPLIGELTLQKVARVLEDLLAAVDHAGRAGIVHRDLKPENALITREGHVKVADFGIAKAAASGQKGLTSEGMTVGTPEYMSPEQAMARELGPQSDLYSVGCMTYEMLTGRLPFTEPSQVALLMRHINDPVPDVRQVDPLIPESVALWVARMTAKDPDERFPDAATAWEAFEEALLEFVGPLWRRDAMLKPASGIDLDDIPPQGQAPLRPTARPGTPGGTGTSGLFQTFHAPAGLHEQLAAERGNAPNTVSSPAPAPTTQATPAVVTPPAVPAAPRPTPAPQPAVRPPTVATPAVEQAPERKVPVGPIALGALVVAIIAFVVGMSGGSEQAASARGDGFVLKAPTGWARSDAVGGLGAGAVALAPPGAESGEGIAAARVDGAGLARLLRGRRDPQRVRLDAGEAASYGGSLFALPTQAGTIVVRCSAAPAVRGACAEVAGSLEVTRGGVRPLGPTDEGASAVRRALDGLRQAIRNPTEDLGDARTAGAQATAASDLARAYRRAASALRRAPVGALAERARNSLAAAVGRAGAGWSAYARAARARDAAAANRARAAVSRARTRVAAARDALADAGYPKGGG